MIAAASLGTIHNSAGKLAIMLARRQAIFFSLLSCRHFWFRGREPKIAATALSV
jgi:hypothetical protein